MMRHSEPPTEFKIPGNIDVTNWFGGRFLDAPVLVTGHTGFKGSWLCRWLHLCGAKVHGYALDPPAHASLHDQLKLGDVLASDQRGDISDASRLKQLVEQVQPRFVFHLAAQPLVRYSYESPVETFATNVQGTVHVLDALRSVDHTCQAVVVTTDKCYANQEWEHGYREVDPLGGKDPYSASKAAAELVTASYRDSFFCQGPVRVASARAGNVIGGGDWATDRIVPDCIRAIRAGIPIGIRNRFSTRPWQHVLEPLSGYLWLAAKLDMASDTYGQKHDSSSSLESAFNFGPPLHSNRTVADLVAELVREFPGATWRDESDPHASHEASRLDLAIAKSHHLLGWTPAWDFRKTVRLTAEWYQAEQTQADMAEYTDGQIHRYCQDASDNSMAWAQEPNIVTPNQPTDSQQAA
ncbi:MAG: CDP-glucose 4,6-dehydratase [Planctomycetota bacterium]